MQLNKKRSGIELISIINIYNVPDALDKDPYNITSIPKEQLFRCRFWDPIGSELLFSCRTLHDIWFHINSEWIFGPKGIIGINPIEKCKE